MNTILNIKNKLIIGLGIALGIFFKPLQLSAQDTASAKFDHGIGAGIGFTTGYGLSYRYMPAKFGGQINFAPYHDKQKDMYSIGLTFLYRLIENKASNLYLYQGNHYYYHSYTSYSYDPNLPDGTKEQITEKYMNNGVGFGMEFIVAKRIGFNLMAGFAAYDNFSQLNLTGETALYYKF